jgi:hypothetical protein
MTPSVVRGSAAWRNRLQKIWHYFAALAIAMDARGGWPFIVFCLAASTTVAVITAFHHRIERRFPRVVSLIVLLEGIACAIVGTHSLLEGRRVLPFIWFLASVLCVAATIVSFLRHGRLKRSAG